MYYVRLMFWLLSITCLVFMLLGLIKPWALLWWEDVQNRKKVIIVYGSLSVFFYLAYLVMGVILPESLVK